MLVGSYRGSMGIQVWQGQSIHLSLGINGLIHDDGKMGSIDDDTANLGLGQNHY